MEINEMQHIIREEFAAVVARLGLQGPVQIERNMSFSLGYFGDDLGLEILVDMSDFFIYALVFQTSTIDIPVGYVNEHGQRHKIFLQQALKEIGILDDTITRQIQKLGGDYNNCRLIAAQLANLVALGWPAIVAHSNEIFRVI